MNQRRIVYSVIVFILVAATAVFAQNPYRHPVLQSDREGEFILDTVITTQYGIGNKRYQDCAFDGANYLLVWAEYRSGSAEIYGTRITPQGEILDPLGIPITTGIIADQPAVAFDGENYMVVWREYILPWLFSQYTACWPGVFGKRIGQNGVVLDSQAIAICTTDVYAKIVDISFDGANYLVVWSSAGFGNGTYGARVSPAGAVLDIPPIELHQYLSDPPAVASGNSNYMVVSGVGWLYGWLVTPQGGVFDTVIIADPETYPRFPAIAHDGTNFLVVWEGHFDNESVSRVFGCRVDESGNVLDTASIIISDTLFAAMHPDLTFNGTDYFVVWHEGWYPYEAPIYGRIEVVGSRVDTSGVVIDTEDIRITHKSEHQVLPCITAGTTENLVVWQELAPIGTEDGYRLCGARVESDGTVIDSLSLDLSVTVPGSQFFSAAVYNGSNYLCVWEDHHYDSLAGFYQCIHGMRVDPSGSVIDAVAFPIGVFSPETLYEHRQAMLSPAIAANGDTMLVVWHEELRNRPGSTDFWKILGARVTSDGEVLDSLGFPISDTFACAITSAPDVACNGNFLVVWQFFGGSGYDILGALVSTGGNVVDTLTICSENHKHVEPSIIAPGSPDIPFLVVWEDTRSSSEPDIYGARVQTDGVVLDPGGMAISLAPDGQFAPAVGFDGTNYLVVWQDHRNWNTWWSDTVEIYGARITQDGTVLDPDGFRISPDYGVHTSPHIMFDGANYLVVWEHLAGDIQYDIYGAKVSPSGQIINTYLIVIESGDQTEPHLASGPDQILLTYTGWTNKINDQAVGVNRIWGKFYPFIGAQEQGGKPIISNFALNLHPNPCRGKVTVNFVIPGDTGDGTSSIRIYDVSGRLVKKFADLSSSDTKQIIWNGTDEYGRILPQGVYYCQLRIDSANVVARKIVFLK